MGATDRGAPSALGEGRGEGAVAVLVSAAAALPILTLPTESGAAEVSEVGFTLLGYKERGLMKVTEPIVWAKGRFGDSWEVSGSALIDIVSGASPEGVSNVSGRPVQTISGASITDRRKQGDIKVARRMGEFTLAGSGAWSSEEDYFSRAFGLEARLDLNQRNTSLVAGFGHSSDRVGSSDDPGLDEPRTTREYMFGVTQVLSRTAAIQSTLTHARGNGWYNDPYRYTFTFYPEQGLAPVFMPDTRPGNRDGWAWLTRYRQRFTGAQGTLQADYRFYADDWSVRGHTFDVAWQQDLGEHWAVRPGLRYYTQRAAEFYRPVLPVPQPAISSSDQRLASFGSVSPSLRVLYRFDNGVTVEGTAGYTYSSASLRMGGGGSEAFEPLRAWYGIFTVSRVF